MTDKEPQSRDPFRTVAIYSELRKPGRGVVARRVLDCLASRDLCVKVNEDLASHLGLDQSFSASKQELLATDLIRC